MDITTDQLRQMIHLKERIEFLQALLQRIRGGGSATKTAGQKAQLKAAPKKSTSVKIAPKKRVSSPETKAKLAAAMKTRWKKTRN